MNDSSEPLLVEQRTDGNHRADAETTRHGGTPWTRHLCRHWLRLCRIFDRTRPVRCVVVTGNGTAFCSGCRSWSTAGPTEAGCDWEAATCCDASTRCFWDSGELRMPVIAAVNGAAVGAGLNLALSCGHSNCCAIGTLRGVLRPFGHPSGRGDNLSPHTPRGVGSGRRNVDVGPSG